MAFLPHKKRKKMLSFFYYYFAVNRDSDMILGERSYYM